MSSFFLSFCDTLQSFRFTYISNCTHVAGNVRMFGDMAKMLQTLTQTYDIWIATLGV